MESNPNLKIAAVIPTFNRKDCLRTLLTCLRNQEKLDFTVYPVCVVDGSTDGTLEMLRDEFPEALVVKGDGSWWYTRCINEGMKKALSLGLDYILTLNDDIIFSEKYVATLLNAAKEHGETCMVGSVSYTQSLPHRITFSGIRKVVKWRLKEYNYIPKFTVADPHAKTGCLRSVNLSGRGILFPVEIINTLGFYDEKLIQYGSDTDFSYRAHKAGINVLISYDAIVFENEKLTSKGASHNRPGMKEYIRSMFDIHSANSIKKGLYFYSKHVSFLLIPLYFLIIILGAIYDLFLKYRKLR